MLLRLLKTILNATAGVLLALLLIFEEWGWEPLARVLAQLAKLPLWARAERFIASLPPWAALLAFLVPMLALFPVKLLALFWIGRGHPLAGLLLILAAKLAGTAILARLFGLTQPALMKLPWFARWYPRWKNWKDAMIARVKSTPLWAAGRRLSRRARRSARCSWLRLRKRWA